MNPSPQFTVICLPVLYVLSSFISPLLIVIVFDSRSLALSQRIGGSNVKSRESLRFKVTIWVYERTEVPNEGNLILPDAENSDPENAKIWVV
jgi:hypothetical protein